MIHFDIQKERGATIYKQLYSQFIDKILNHELEGDYKLPGSRTLSKNLGIARNIVVDVYEQLMSEGYIYSMKGSGSYVSSNIELNHRIGNEISKESREVPEIVIDEFEFESGIPDLKMFPREKWGKCLKNSIMDCPSEKFHYGDIRGERSLQNELAGYLLRNKGINCKPENIFIVSGTSQAVFILSQIISSVIIEDPSVNFIKSIFSSNNTDVEYIETDEEGLITSSLSSNSQSEMLMVSPSHQFPLGGTLSIQRRLEMINYAEKYNKYIIEDDYDSEFRFKGTPVNSIYRLSPSRVIHIGTFSKILSPSIRLGYMLIPDELESKVEKVKENLNILTPVLIQLAMADFIRLGYLERHIYSMRKCYNKKQDYIIGLLKKSFGNKIGISGTSTGLHFIVDIESGIDNPEELKNRALEAGIKLSLVDDYSSGNNEFINRVIIGFGSLSYEEIDKGVSLLKSIFEI